MISQDEYNNSVIALNFSILWFIQIMLSNIRITCEKVKEVKVLEKKKSLFK
jgi:hypothetical protein